MPKFPTENVWFASSPSKRWTEELYLGISVIWIVAAAAVVSTGYYEVWKNAHYLVFCGSCASLFVIIPWFAQRMVRGCLPESRGRARSGGRGPALTVSLVVADTVRVQWGLGDASLPLAQRYWVKVNVWVAIVSYVGNIHWTHYFYQLLGAKYTFDSWRLNNVPFAMALMTHAYFSFYFVFSNVRTRWLLSPSAGVEECVGVESREEEGGRRRREVGEGRTAPKDGEGRARSLFSAMQSCLRRLWTSTTYKDSARSVQVVLSSAVVLALALFTAFMETFTISGFPYYSFLDRYFMYTVGSACYAIYFIVLFPMFYECVSAHANERLEARRISSTTVLSPHFFPHFLPSFLPSFLPFVPSGCSCETQNRRGSAQVVRAGDGRARARRLYARDGAARVVALHGGRHPRPQHARLLLYVSSVPDGARELSSFAADEGMCVVMSDKEPVCESSEPLASEPTQPHAALGRSRDRLLLRTRAASGSVPSVHACAQPTSTEPRRASSPPRLQLLRGQLRQEHAEALLHDHAVLRELVVRREARCATESRGGGGRRR